MTSITGILAAFAIILIDLASRAGLDKALALTGGPEQVALWAQVQSVVELVSTVAVAGVLQGLTVMVSQSSEPEGRRGLLRDALRLALVISLTVTLFVPMLGNWLTGGGITAGLFWLAALSGCLAVIPATLNAYWLGLHQQQRMAGLALLAGAILLLVAAGAWAGLGLRGLLLMQCLALLLSGFIIWRYLRRLSDGGNTHPEQFRKLVKFVPVGLAIGIMSPVAMLLVRGTLSGALSWEEVGVFQALWRAVEWVTATTAGMLSLIFLPRLGNAYGRLHSKPEQFILEIRRAATAVLIPAACLLGLMYAGHDALLVALYDKRFAVSDETAALFLLGSWVRVASWVFLFGLFAAHRTWLIVAGEALSLPLFVLLLWQFSEEMSLERAAMLYLVSYLAYLGFNALALRYALRQTPDEAERP